MSKYAEPAKTTRAKNTTKMSGTTNKLLWLKKNQQTGKNNGMKAGKSCITFPMPNQHVGWGKGGAKN